MTDEAKEAPPKPEARNPRKAVAVPLGGTDDETERNLAALVTSPELAAYRVINGAEAKSGLGELIDVPYLMEQLRRQAAAINSGDLAQAEAMLMNQATALQSLFARLAERGIAHNDAVPFELNMRMALRAQSQCRATLETLAAIKNPQPVAFVRQANIAAGPQQVNNGVSQQVRAGARARENETAPNKLLEAQHGERLDAQAARAASDNDSHLGAMDAVHGATNDPG